MIIKVYSICWNEERMLPYFLRHYEQFADEIVIFDNYSTDTSHEIICNHPKASMHLFDTNNRAHEPSEIDIKNHKWKKERDADWVIVVDTDEFIYHPNLVGYLRECQEYGITLPIPTGYHMVGDHFPTQNGQIYDEITMGIRDDAYDKMAVFDPRQIEEINYGPGCHPQNGKIDPSGVVIEDRNKDLKLLHYKFLGLDWVVKRYHQLSRRKSKEDIRCGYGKRYFAKPNEIKEMYERDLVKRKKII